MLKRLCQFWPVAVVSGRSLNDIKKRIRLKGLIYAGNHGLEWKIGKKNGRVILSKKVARQLLTARQQLEKLLSAYPGALLEDKQLTLAVHYRRLSPSLIAPFKKDMARIIRPLINKNGLGVSKGKKVIELRSNITWNKGKFVVLLQQHFRGKHKPFSIGIGDDITDEDIFQKIGSGITVKVGRDKRSKAQYYVRNHRQVKTLLKFLLKFAQARRALSIPFIKGSSSVK